MPQTAPAAETEARQLAKRVAQLEAENAQLRDGLARCEQTPEWLAEALNSGDGTYRP